MAGSVDIISSFETKVQADTTTRGGVDRPCGTMRADFTPGEGEARN
jgi:hypothetical protein